MSLDYWNIEIEDTYRNSGAENIVRQCATNGVLCDQLLEGPTGNLWQGEIPRVVQWPAKHRYGITSGVDVAASWSMDALGGTFGVNLRGTYLTEWEIEILPG